MYIDLLVYRPYYNDVKFVLPARHRLKVQKRFKLWYNFSKGVLI